MKNNDPPSITPTHQLRSYLGKITTGVILEISRKIHVSNKSCEAIYRLNNLIIICKNKYVFPSVAFAIFNMCHKIKKRNEFTGIKGKRGGGGGGGGGGRRTAVLKINCCRRPPSRRGGGGGG